MNFIVCCKYRDRRGFISKQWTEFKKKIQEEFKKRVKKIRQDALP